MPPRKKTEKVIKDEPVVKPAVKYVSVQADLIHPFQNIWIRAGEPVEAKLDNWLKSQIEAGLIKCL